MSVESKVERLQRMRQNKEKHELLIESVKHYTALYDKADEDHNSYIYKHKCWEKISATIGLPVSDCKRRWKGLRDHYHKKIKDQELGKPNTNWEYMNLMSFLSETPERRKTTTNNHSEENYENNSKEWHTTYFENNDVEETYSEKDPTIQYNTEDSLPSLDPLSSKKRKLNTQEISDEQENFTPSLLETSQFAKPQSTMKKFFESMAEIVETFPIREQAIVRAKVCQLISDAEILLLQDSTP